MLLSFAFLEYHAGGTCHLVMVQIIVHITWPSPVHFLISVNFEQIHHNLSLNFARTYTLIFSTTLPIPEEAVVPGFAADRVNVYSLTVPLHKSLEAAILRPHH